LLQTLNFFLISSGCVPLKLGPLSKVLKSDQVNKTWWKIKALGILLLVEHDYHYDEVVIKYHSSEEELIIYLPLVHSVCKKLKKLMNLGKM
jgi:hypothetical protein